MSINSIFAGSTPNSRDAIRQQYLNYLTLDIANQTKNLNANKLFKANGTTGSAPADTRSATEKYADLDGLKQSVRAGLRQITDGRESEMIVAELTTNEIEFLAGSLPAIIADLKPKWALGVPAGSFIPYFRKYMRKAIETEGVEYGIQQPQVGGVGGGILTTAENLVPRNQLDDLMGNLELASRANTNISERSKQKIENLIIGNRGKNVEQFRKKMPTPEDRVAVASEGDLEVLYQYDQWVSELGENTPSEQEVVELTRKIMEDIEFDRYEDLDDMLYELESLLDAIDFDILDAVYDTADEARRRLRNEKSAPAQKQEEFINNLYSAFRQGGIEEVVEPYMGEELLARPRQAFGREIAPEQEESNLPTAYAVPQQPSFAPRAGFGEGGAVLTPEEFSTLRTFDKIEKLKSLMRKGEFAEYPELAPEIISLNRGLMDDDNELDYFYGHYYIVSGKDEENRPEPPPEEEEEEESVVSTPSASSKASSVRSSPELVDTPSPVKAVSKKGLPDSIEEFQKMSLETRRDILRGLSDVPRQLEKDIAKLAEKARDTTVDRLYERYLYYKQAGEENPALSQSAVKDIPSVAGKKGVESTIGTTEVGSPEKGSARSINAPTEDLFAQPSTASTKAKVEFHYPKTTTEFYKLEVADKRKVIDRTIRDEIYDADRYTDIMDKDYDQEVADKVEGFVKDFQKTEPSQMSGKKLQEIYDTIFPFIKDGQATGRVGFGIKPKLPEPHHIIGTHGYGLLTSQGRPNYVGNGLKKKSKPMVSNDVIHIDFEKGSIPKVGLDGTKKKKKGNIIFGGGLASVMPQPKVRVEPKNIDFSKGITAEPAYVPFGTHLLNKHKLKDNIVMMRTKKGGAIVNIPTQRVSGKLSKVLHTITGGGIPQFESVMDLEDDDKALLHRITKTSKVSDRLSVPNPNKSKMEEEDNRFNILRGEVSIGNDNPAVIKEFKVLLLKFMREGRVPMGQGKAIMEELLLLGY